MKVKNQHEEVAYSRPFTVYLNSGMRKINDLKIVNYLIKQARKEGQEVMAVDCFGKEVVYN